MLALFRGVLALFIMLFVLIVVSSIYAIQSIAEEVFNLLLESEK